MHTSPARRPVFYAILLPLVVACWPTAADADTLRTVAFSGDAAIGTDVEFSYFSSPLINNTGQTLFHGVLAGSTGVDRSNDAGIWSEGSGALALVVREGNNAPGTDGRDLKISPTLPSTTLVKRRS